MNQYLERTWVSLVHTDTRRRFVRSALGSMVLRSRAFLSVDNARHRKMASLWWRHHGDTVADVSILCAFLGHVKSGGTLLGSLLDAHPHAAFADETDVLRYVAAGFDKDAILYLLLRGSRHEALKGRVTARRLEPYSFAISGQWQGCHSNLRAVGFSRAGPTTRQLGNEPNLLNDLRRALDGVGMRFIHVVRDPIDPISAMMLRGRRSFSDAVADFFGQCRRLVDIRTRVDPDELLTVRYEDVVTRPAEQLQVICRFLGLEANDHYLTACTAVVRPDVRRERERVEWDPDKVRTVREEASRFDFLEGYVHAI